MVYWCQGLCLYALTESHQFLGLVWCIVSADYRRLPQIALHKTADSYRHPNTPNTPNTHTHTHITAHMHKEVLSQPLKLIMQHLKMRHST